jgi:hypothetical protein
MLQHYATYPYAGFTSGVQLGRWRATHLGVWKVDDVYEPREITQPDA